jgi:hypothetical protein
MPNVTLTQEQIEFAIYALAFNYASTADEAYINTANAIAVETTNEPYFRGINKGLGIIYPIPIEDPPIEEPI